MVGLTEQEILTVLAAIERREVTFPKAELAAARESYSGNVELHASNGWTFIIFNDCDEWDYIDTVIAPDGRSAGYDEIAETMPAVERFEINPDTAVEIWGLPV